VYPHTENKLSKSRISKVILWQRNIYTDKPTSAKILPRRHATRNVAGGSNTLVEQPQNKSQNSATYSGCSTNEFTIPRTYSILLIGLRSLGWLCQLSIQLYRTLLYNSQLRHESTSSGSRLLTIEAQRAVKCNGATDKTVFVLLFWSLTRGDTLYARSSDINHRASKIHYRARHQLSATNCISAPLRPPVLIHYLGRCL